MPESTDRQNWKRLDELFQRAADLPPAERRRFLDEACKGDSGIRQKIDAMLASLTDSSDVVAASVAGAARDFLDPEEHQALPAGKEFGHYRIVGEVGAGGMGRVYRAIDQLLDRDVAIKTLSPDVIRNRHVLRQFEEEARAASALNHPNILTIYEAGELDGRRFIASEFVNGPTLRLKLATGPLDVATALDIAIQVASGLVASHAAKIIHRDIKPENLIVRDDGLVKIVDFGIAKLSEERRRNSTTGIRVPGTRANTGAQPIVGTARYMSPEQARGQNVDGRTDLFSLGTVIYEMCAGQAPFQGDTDSDVFAEILKTDPTPLRQIVPGVPMELSLIVSKAMRKNRDERYENAGQMLAALRNLREELSFQAKLSTSGLRAVQSGSRRALFASFAAVAVLAAGAGVYIWRSAFRSSAPPPRPRSLAILPFHNIRPDPASDFLGFSLADAVITKLGSIHMLTVRPSSAVARYRNQEVDPQDAGRALGVDTLLTGSYIKEGANLRITAQLVDVKSLNILWRDTIDLRYDNLLAVNDRVAEDIISGLALKLTPSEIETLRLDNPRNRQAYEDYLRGVDLYAMNDFESSIATLERSVSLDGSYGPAWTSLGRAYEANASLQFGGRSQYQKAQAAFEKALRLNANAIEPRVYMANLLTDTGRVEEAVPLLRAAIDQNYNSASAHWELGYAYRFGGMLQDSARECELARKIDPSVKITSSAINAYFYMGQYDKWLASLPDSNTAYILFYRGLGELYKGDTANAKKHFDQAYELDPALQQADLGQALSDHIAGQDAVGIQVLREVESKILDRGVTDAEGIYKVAQAYAVLGDRQSALRLFRRTIEGGFFCYPYFENDPLLQNLRVEPGFAPLMQQAKQRNDAFRAKFAP
ncbi:MAG TPA: protein kinase [Verrucomicrobiae bacterium]|nr:protein kinase [Verrucomicrobiae bacterium]